MRQVLPVVPAKYNQHYLITVVRILVINRARIRKNSENLDVGVILSSCIVKSKVGYFAYSLDDVVASTCPVTVKQ